MLRVALSAPGVVRGALVGGDVDTFRSALTAASAVRIFTSSVEKDELCPIDTIIALLDASGAQVAYDDDGIDLCSLIEVSRARMLRQLPAGACFVRVTPYSGGARPVPYALHVDFIAG